MEKKEEKHLSANMEDYLEAIATLKKEAGVARVRDIGRALNVKNPSVNAALNTLSRAGLVDHERYGYVDLTKKGEARARDIIFRHNTFVRFLTIVLGVDLETAQVDACRMEHSMSGEGFERMARFVEYVELCKKQGKAQWLEEFEHFANTGSQCAGKEKVSKTGKK